MIRALSGRVALILAMASIAVSCAGPGQVTIATGFEYIPGRSLDVHYPTVTRSLFADSSAVPIVVLIHGAGLDRDDYTEFATRLATEGAAVFNADWDPLPNRIALALDEIACAVRYAREHGPAYGGDPAHLLLVAHSTGAVYAGEVSTAGDQYTGACPIGGSALPDGLAILAPAQVPGGAPWPHSSLGGNPDLRVVVIHGVDDEVVAPQLSERTVQLLEEAGYAVTFHLVSGGHNDLVAVNVPAASQVSLDASSETIASILDLADAPSGNS